MRISDWSSDVCSSDLRYPDVAQDRLLRELVREQIGVMANDLIAATRANIAAAGVESVDDVRRAGRALVGFSPELAAQERSEEHTSELQSLMRISYAVFCLTKKIHTYKHSIHYSTYHTNTTNTILH